MQGPINSLHCNATPSLLAQMPIVSGVQGIFKLFYISACAFFIHTHTHIKHYEVVALPTLRQGKGRYDWMKGSATRKTTPCTAIPPCTERKI